jgi:hypothetical protein
MPAWTSWILIFRQRCLSFAWRGAEAGRADGWSDRTVLRDVVGCRKLRTTNSSAWTSSEIWVSRLPRSRTLMRREVAEMLLLTLLSGAARSSKDRGIPEASGPGRLLR